METARYKTVNRAAETQPAAVQKNAQTVAVAHCNGMRLQTASKVSSPLDPAEQEAESTSKKIMRMAVPESSIAYVKTSGAGVFRQVKQEEKDKKLQPKLQSPYLTRFADSGVFAQRREDKLQRKAEGQAPIAPKVSADIQASTTAGTPLPMGVRRFMEPRFRADFGQVKIHTGDKSAKLNRQLNAKAFAVGNQIFFGKDQFKPESQEGQGLIAHELTHTIQQGGSVQRSAEPIVHEHSAPQVQRLFGIDTDPRAYLAKKADEIPGFAMLTVVIGYNPITNAKVDRSAGNLLRGAIKMIPVAGGYIAEALENHGIFDKVSQFVSGQFDTLKDIGGSLIANIEAFIKDVSITDLVHPGEVIERGKRIVTNAIDRIISFATGLKNTVITLIKDAILKPLAAFAKKNAPNGYDLLSAVLGKDPISGETVEQSAENLIAPFMKMIGQEEVWNNMKEAKAIPRCWAWYQTEKGKVKALVQELPTEFVNAFKSLEVIDIVLLPRAFAKLAVVFGGVAAKFIKWGGEAVWNLLEIIFDVLAPNVMPYVKKAQAAFKTILKNPIGFVGNLVRAGKQGFEMFAGNILEHLKAALIKWIVGPLADAGVYIPKAFSLIEIVKLVLSVLGLTWQNIRSKLVKIIPEPVLVGLEKTASILVTLVKDGPAAAWEQIKTELSELKDQLIAQVSEMVTTEVVKAAVMKLVSMLNPAGAVVQAIIAVYNTITFFIEKAKQIGAVVAAFIDSIAAIAAGQVSAAASKVEQTLANTLTVVIAFLAKFAGLGGIPAKVTGIIKKIRKPIDKGLDKIVGWLGKMLQKAKGALSGKSVVKEEKPKTPEPPSNVQRPRVVVNFVLGAASHELILDPKGGNEPQVEMASGNQMPFEKRQRDAYNGIEYFKQYMTTITEAQVRREYETKLKPLIDGFQTPNVDAWKTIYKAKFPGKTDGPPISDAEAKSRAEVVAKEAEALLAKLKGWGATSGIPDLAKDAVVNTLLTKGQAIWKEAWEERKKQVEAAIASVNYKGVKLEYRGSLKKGFKGEQKNLTRFNPSDFDVDMYVVHPVDFQAAVKNGAKLVGGQIFPNDPFAPAALRSTSTAVANALRKALPDVTRSGTSNVTLRGEVKA